MFFVIPNLTTCQFSSGAREPISVANSFDLLRKRRIMLEDVIVSRGKTKIGDRKKRVTLHSSFMSVV
jgi:hypothetical protein